MRSFLRGTGWVLAILGAIGLLLYLFVFDTFVVPGGDPVFVASIEPNLRPQDRLLTRRGSTPVYGQLARCRSPLDPTKIVIGRVFGAGGDTVEVRNENVFTDGKGYPPRHGCPPVTLAHPATGELLQLRCAVEENPAWTYQTLRWPSDFVAEGDAAAVVDQGKLFLVSDDRHLHQDSRDFGGVDASTCEHIVFRLWGESYVDNSRRFTILW